MVWEYGTDTYDGDLEKQYANGSFSEVWFRKATVGAATPPYESDSISLNHSTKLGDRLGWPR